MCFFFIACHFIRTVFCFPIRISDNPKLGMLREGLKLFISHFLLKNIQKSAEEAELLRQKADIALKALQAKDKLRL